MSIIIYSPEKPEDHCDYCQQK